MVDDVRLAWRRLRNAPAFTLAAVVTLSLAIGANVAIFTVADAVLFRPLPYSDPERLFVVRYWNRETGTRSSAVPLPYIEALAQHHDGIESIAFRGPTSMTVHAGSIDAEWMETFAVSADYFRVLGIRPPRGRLFEPTDADPRERAVMLSYETWQRRFGADERIVGRSLPIGGDDRTVVGVLPRGFVFPVESIRFLHSTTGRPDFVRMSNRRTYGPGMAIDAIVRLRPGVTRERAQAQMDVLLAPIRAQRPRDAARVPVLDDPRFLLIPSGRPVIVLVGAAAGLVLLIGCANLANMFLARTRRRERELGIHAALGATRLRLVRPLLIEAALVGTVAAVVALLQMTVAFGALLREVPPAAYGTIAVALDLRVGAFAIFIGLLAGGLFGALPAWSAAKLDVQASLQQRRLTRSRMLPGHPLLILQVAIAIVLLSGAVVAARAFVSVLRLPLGFSPEGVLTLHVSPTLRSRTEARDFYVRAVAALAARGDVIAAAAGTTTPLDGWAPETSIATGPDGLVGVNSILPGYFEALGVARVAGRFPVWDDLRQGAEVAVLSASAAGALFGGADPLGRVLALPNGRRCEVVGVVADVRTALDRASHPAAYVLLRDTDRAIAIVARVRARGSTILQDLRREIATQANGAPVTATWIDDLISRSAAYRNPRFQTVVLGTFAALALGLTALGVFAVVSFLVAMRTREMGIRMALGAPPRALVTLVVRQTLQPAAAGILAGGIAIWLLAGVVESRLAGIDARDPLVFAGAAAAVALAAGIAAYVPARRAELVDPIMVLRAE